MTSLTVRPETPSPSSASWTSWRRSWRMMASIFCMALVLPPQRDRHGLRRWARGAARRRVVLVAGHRHELLGIAPHPVLDDVEAVALLVGLHAQADRRLDGEEDGERDDE